MRYVLAVIANDPSRVVRRHVARNACQSLAILVQMGEMKSSSKETESLLIEEDGTAPEKTKELKKSEIEAMIKVLRKDREVGKNEALREFLMPIILWVQPRCPCSSYADLSLPLDEGHLMSIMKFGGAFSSWPIFSFVLSRKQPRR